MPSGIRATVEFTCEDICPIVELSSETGATVNTVSTNVCPSETAQSVTEFSIAIDESEDEFEPIFSTGETNRYRLTHDEGVNCPCECLGRFGCPISRYVARDGTLTLEFFATDYEQLQEIVTELRNRYPDIYIKRFVRSSTGRRREDTVFVDRSKLTSRQLDVLQTAHEMGYFQRIRGANATEVAEAIDIDISTFREHLVAAERKLLEDILGNGCKTRRAEPE